MASRGVGERVWSKMTSEGREMRGVEIGMGMPKIPTIKEISRGSWGMLKYCNFEEYSNYI